MKEMITIFHWDKMHWIRLFNWVIAVPAIAIIMQT